MAPRILKRPPHGWARTRSERIDAWLSGLWPMLVISAFACTLAISVFGATVETLNQLLVWAA